jgi:hypothetical protein
MPPEQKEEPRKMKRRGIKTLLQFSLLSLFVSSIASAQCPGSGPGSIVANPNRPTVADPADITQYGVMELEYGYDRVNTGSAQIQNNLGGLLKFAATCNLEIRWEMGTLLNQPARNLSTTGTGDNWLGFQYRFHRQTKLIPAMAFGYSLKFPSASVAKGLGSGRYDHQTKFLASKDFGKFHFDYNLSFNIVGRQGTSVDDHNVESNLAFSRTIYKKLLFTAEIYGDTKVNADTPPFASGLWAFTYAVSPRFVIDAGMDHGLTNGAPNKQSYFTGFTYSIVDLYSRR